MRLEVKKYLFDIRRAADLIAEFTCDSGVEQYCVNVLLRSAVERQLTTIGEALNPLAKVDGTLAASVTNHRQIVALRNILVHAYAEIDARIVWSIVENELPTLRREVDALLTGHGRE